jgi:hypothetical protein
MNVARGIVRMNALLRKRLETTKKQMAGRKLYSSRWASVSITIYWLELL